MSLYKIGRAISHWLSFPSPSNKFQYGTLKAQISRFFARGTRGATWRRFSMAHLYLTFSRPIQRYQPRVNATSGKSKYPSVPSFALHNVNLVGVYVAYGRVSVGWSLSLLKNCSFFLPGASRWQKSHSYYFILNYSIGLHISRLTDSTSGSLLLKEGGWKGA